MSSRSLEDLVPEAQQKAGLIINACKEAEIDLLVYCTLRTLEEQARLYRQSRSYKAISIKMSKFRARGFGYLADVLESVGPCNGPHVTNAGPGESWHNYGQAFDAVPVINGKAAWNYMKARDEWNGYGEAVRLAGMNWAGDWTSFREYPHAQLLQGGNPLKSYSSDKIKKMLVDAKLLKI